jgi:hypothetical protein
MTPLVVIILIWSEFGSVNHRLPSGPVVMARVQYWGFCKPPFTMKLVAVPLVPGGVSRTAAG